MGLTDSPTLPTTSRLGVSDISAVIRFWDSIYSVFTNPTALLSFTRLSQSLDRDGSLSSPKALLLSICFIVMAGCGFLSLILRRKCSGRTSGNKRCRRGARRKSSKTSAGTFTSSEDEGYDSSGSLRHGTDSAFSTEKTEPQRRELPDDGLRAPSPTLLSTYC